MYPTATTSTTLTAQPPRTRWICPLIISICRGLAEDNFFLIKSYLKLHNTHSSVTLRPHAPSRSRFTQFHPCSISLHVTSIAPLKLAKIYIPFAKNMKPSSAAHHGRLSREWGNDQHHHRHHLADRYRCDYIHDSTQILRRYRRYFLSLVLVSFSPLATEHYPSQTLLVYIHTFFRLSDITWGNYVTITSYCTYLLTLCTERLL